MLRGNQSTVIRMFVMGRLDFLFADLFFKDVSANISPRAALLTHFFPTLGVPEPRGLWGF